MPVTCDGSNVGTTHEKTYLFTILDPGAHTFTSTSENESKLQVTLEAGKIYYLEQQVKYGFSIARTHLVLVDGEKGKAFIAKTKLSADNVYKLE